MRDKQARLDAFRTKVMDGGNTVDFFEDSSDLKYRVGQALKNARESAGPEAGWLRYRDALTIINERIEWEKNHAESRIPELEGALNELKELLSSVSARVEELSSSAPTWEELPSLTQDDLDEIVGAM